MSAGVLHLLPVTLGGSVEQSLPAAVIEVAQRLDYFIVENEKNARAFLKSIAHPIPLRQITIRLLERDSSTALPTDLLQPLLAGRNAGVLSEAGCPVIADPGAALVEAAHRLRIRVTPHVGPSSLLLALMASGFNGQRFAFHGYLPVAKDECRSAIERLERESQQLDQTQLFIETPYRSDALLQTLLSVCANDTRLCIASDLTLPTESVRTASIATWKKTLTEIGRRPTVFLIYTR
jgi:16S rRNA (cytidine1402-2'-O)-methyltransferase